MRLQMTSSMNQPTTPLRERNVQPLLSCLFVLFAALFLLTASPAGAQLAGKGEIKGTVTDPSGAVVPGATVTATSTTRGTKTAVKSSSSGLYDISPLDPDIYTVTATAQGFSTTNQENVHVNALEI